MESAALPSCSAGPATCSPEICQLGLPRDPSPAEFAPPLAPPFADTRRSTRMFSLCQSPTASAPGPSNIASSSTRSITSNPKSSVAMVRKLGEEEVRSEGCNRDSEKETNEDDGIRMGMGRKSMVSNLDWILPTPTPSWPRAPGFRIQMLAPTLVMTSCDHAPGLLLWMSSLERNEHRGATRPHAISAISAIPAVGPAVTLGPELV